METELTVIGSFIQPNTNQSERENLKGDDISTKTDHRSSLSLLSYDISTSEL